MYKVVFLILLIISGTVRLMAQEILWANELVYVSSEFSRDRHSGAEILGVPNVAPVGMSSTYAWCVQPNAVDAEGVETAYIEVQFAQQAVVSQIAVFESYNPGAVAEILVQTADGWKSVYADTAAIRRTAYLPTPEYDNSALKALAGKNRGTIFNKKDYRSPAKYNIINAFFEKEKVFAARVVLNLYAIDGWNEIDAIGITNSSTPITYPAINEFQEPIFADDQKHRLNNRINTEYSEIKPVLATDEKRLYFTRTNHPDNKHGYSQDIWHSESGTDWLESCDNCEQRSAQEWQWPTNYTPPYNNILPNSVLGFSSNGKYMFLNNNYIPVGEDCDCDSVFRTETHGISISRWDTAMWQKGDLKLKKHFDKALDATTETVYANKEKQLAIASLIDTTQFGETPAIYMAYSSPDSSWSAPVLIGLLNANVKFRVPENMYQGHETLYFVYDGQQIDSCGSIGWGEPQPMMVPGLESYGNYIDLDIAANDEVLFVAIEKDSLRSRDIFVSFLDNAAENKWSELKNIGDNINTISDDCSPFLDKDGTTLYFASAGHHGLGDRDIYACRRLDDTYLKWSDPLNLGRRVNTINSDAFFNIAPQSRVAYFSSTDNATGCVGHSDIFTIRMQDLIQLTLRGSVYDVDHQMWKIPAKVKLNTMADNKIQGFRNMSFSTDEKGDFEVNIKDMINKDQITGFALEASKNGFIMTDKDGTEIKFDEVSVKTADRNMVIYKDLYLRGDTTYQPEEEIIPTPTDLDSLPELVVDVPLGDIDEVMKEDPTKTKGGVAGDIVIDREEEGNICDPIRMKDDLYYLAATTYKQYEMKLIKPGYVKYFRYNDKAIDYKDAEFSRFVETEIKGRMSKIQAGDLLVIYIISSASKVPTYEYAHNYSLAVGRGGEAKTLIANLMKSEGIDPNNFTIKEDNKVDGPEYRDDARTNKAEYEKYQYVKVWVYLCKGSTKE